MAGHHTCQLDSFDLLVDLHAYTVPQENIMISIAARWAMSLLVLAAGAPAVATTYTQAPPMIPNDLARIRVVNSNRCLVMDTSAPYTARFSTCSDSYNQLFLVETDPAGHWFNFRNVATDLCVRNNNVGQPATGGACSLAASPSRHLADLVTAPSYKWYFLEAASQGSWHCLQESAPNNYWGNNYPATYADCMAGPMHDYVYIDHVNTVRLRHESTSQCIYSDGSNGDIAKSFTCWQDPGMAVRMEPVGGSDYRLRNVKTGQCFYGNPTNGGQVHSSGCLNDPNMVWTKQDLGSGRFRLKHKNTGNCMYALPGNGQSVNNFTCWDDPGMVWVADPF